MRQIRVVHPSARAAAPDAKLPPPAGQPGRRRGSNMPFGDSVRPAPAQPLHLLPRAGAATMWAAAGAGLDLN
jgi:hypothetical protein